MDVDVDNTNPRKVPVPDHDPSTQNDPGWEWMGFTVYADPEEMGDVVAALKKEAKALHMKVYEGKRKWPKAPRMASQRKTTKKATDRQLLIRLASSMEKGSPERKAILSGLSRQYRFASLKKTARTMAEFKKEMDKVNRVFNKLMDDYQKAQRTYSDFNEHYEYADYDEGEEDRQQVMELGSKWLADTRRSDKKTLDAIKKFVASIDPAELKENAKWGAETLYKDLNKQLQEVERNIKSKPKDWKEMGKAIHWKTGPRLFRDAGAYMSRLVEAISGESL